CRPRPTPTSRAPPPDPPAQQVQPAKVLDLVGDPSGLGGAEPRPLVLADQALERCPTLERNERKREDQRTDDALHVARRRLFEDEPGEVHQRQGEDVREEQRPSEQRGPP